MGSFKQKGKTQKKIELKSKKKKIIIKLLQAGQWLDSFDWTHCPIQHNFQYFTLLFFITVLFLTRHKLLLIFNYFYLFILNYTRLLSPRFLHFILLNFITSSSTLLHLRYAFILIRNFCVFYQYQCDNASSQVLNIKFLNTIFF